MIGLESWIRPCKAKPPPPPWAIGGPPLGGGVVWLPRLVVSSVHDGANKREHGSMFGC